MNIKLKVEPGIVKRWEEFKGTSHAIALDGYVFGGPQYDPAGPTLNANHHEEVNRLATRSTCAQIFMLLKQGLYPRMFTEEVSVYVNDCDYDVCLSVWLLRNAGRVSGSRSEPLINRLLWAIDMLDATSGAYPLDPNSDLMEEIAWVFHPYTQVRGRVPFMLPAEMESVIEDVCGRISAYSVGKGSKARLDTRYEVLEQGWGWWMVKEIGTEARTGMIHDGVRAFVALKGEKDGRYTYAIGQVSGLVGFPVERIYEALNKAEGTDPTSMERWGGSDLIGGSPRRTGSGLAPKAVAVVIENVLKSSLT